MCLCVWVNLVTERSSVSPCSAHLEQPHLYPLDPEAQRGSRADGLPPLHVAGLGYRPQHVLLLGGGIRVHLNHLLVHVLPQAWLLPGLYQLLLQVCPARSDGGTLARPLHKMPHSHRQPLPQKSCLSRTASPWGVEQCAK